MTRKRFNIKHEHKEILNDLKNVAISYTPLSGIFDTGKFLHKWLFKKRHVHRFGKKMNKKYRMFVLEQIAKGNNSP